jgi:hypothetical protein
MSWEAFLTYPPVVTYHPDAPGKYLFLKTLHELAAGCIAYQAFQQFWDAVKVPPHIDEPVKKAAQILNESPIRAWYDRWFPTVEQWRMTLLVLQTHYWDVPTSNEIDWPGCIDDLATLTAAVVTQYQEAQLLHQPTNTQAREYASWIIDSVARIQEIYQAIRNQEYIRLYDYPDSDAPAM